MCCRYVVIKLASVLPSVVTGVAALLDVADHADPVAAG
jgi:hypothetical protein